MSERKTLIFGCGYLGERVARILIERGEKVIGTTRRESRFDHLTGLGIEPISVDVTRGGELEGLPQVDRILYCVGFDRQAGRSIREVYVDGFQHALEACWRKHGGCPIVYASSTGVYGGNDGAWVDESSPADPQTESGRACFEAEELLVAHAAQHSIGATILRYAGLYGPGRIMRQESLKRGEPVVGSPDKFLNFIQIDDAAAITVRALDEVEPQGTDLFLVSDGHPITRTEFYGVTAELLQAPAPRFEPPMPGSPEARREESNKRISNRKLLGRWGDVLRYADIRSGLAASLAGS